jgi:hypothetical protein
MNAPIDMVLHCPACGRQHIDAPEPHTRSCLTPGGGTFDDQCICPESRWTNPPHRSHLCDGCGHVWRPADVPTNGVEAITTKGQADSPLPDRRAFWRRLDEYVAAEVEEADDGDPGASQRLYDELRTMRA